MALINIAPYGFATQSTLSKWSYDDDAKRALDPPSDCKDFSFCTKGLNNWWLLDLNKNFEIKHVVIWNRKKQQQKSNGIGIQAYSIEDEKWKILANKIIFSGLKQVVDIGLSARFVRIFQGEAEALCLFKIEVWAKVDNDFHAFDTPPPCFLSNRTDGFGQRMLSILETIRRAHVYQGRYFFNWATNKARLNATSHCWPEADYLFSRKFIDDHLVNDIIPLFPSARKYYSASKGIVFEQVQINSDVIFKNIDKPRFQSYKKEFAEVEFSPEIEAVIDHADKLQLPDSLVGLHVRGGDIVYGEYRHTCEYQYKVFPYPALIFMVKKHSNMSFLLFVQDKNLIPVLKKELLGLNNVLFSDDLQTVSLNRFQQTVFDLVLMGRCNSLIGANSGFVVLASVIMGKPLNDYMHYISKEDLNQSLLHAIGSEKNSGEVPQLQAAFLGVYYIMYNFRQVIASEESRLILLQIKELDPNSLLIRFLIVCHFISVDKSDDAFFYMNSNEFIQYLDGYKNNKYNKKPLVALGIIDLLRSKRSQLQPAQPAEVILSYLDN